MRDFIQSKGTAAFGTRLRRLSERLDRQVQAIYRDADTGFEPRWYPVVVALSETGEKSVGELAAMLGITHAAISQLRGQLIAAGLVRGRTDAKDARRQILALTAKGRRMAARLAPLWTAIARATERLLDAEAPDLLAALARVEDAIARKPMPARIAGKARKSNRKSKNHVPRKAS